MSDYPNPEEDILFLLYRDKGALCREAAEQIKALRAEIEYWKHHYGVLYHHRQVKP